MGRHQIPKNLIQEDFPQSNRQGGFVGQSLIIEIRKWRADKGGDRRSQDLAANLLGNLHIHFVCHPLSLEGVPDALRNAGMWVFYTPFTVWRAPHASQMRMTMRFS